MNRKMKRKRSGTSRNFSIDKVEAGDAKQSAMPTATRQTSIGVRKTIAYALAPAWPAHESAEKFPGPRAAGDDGCHDNGSDERAQRIWPAGAAT